MHKFSLSENSTERNWTNLHLGWKVLPQGEIQETDGTLQEDHIFFFLQEVWNNIVCQLAAQLPRVEAWNCSRRCLDNTHCSLWHGRKMSQWCHDKKKKKKRHPNRNFSHSHLTRDSSLCCSPETNALLVHSNIQMKVCFIWKPCFVKNCIFCRHPRCIKQPLFLAPHSRHVH